MLSFDHQNKATNNQPMQREMSVVKMGGKLNKENYLQFFHSITVFLLWMKLQVYRSAPYEKSFHTTGNRVGTERFLIDFHSDCYIQLFFRL